MSDKPIIFSAPMVQALLDGRKTMTRRVLREQPGALDHPFQMGDGSWHVTDSQGGHLSSLNVPYAPGDRLWVREAIDRASQRGDVFYRADYEADYSHNGEGLGWRPSIHMPRWASRLTLTVTDVRVQRVQEISEADAVAEGIERYSADFPSLWRRGRLSGDQNNIFCTAFPKLAFRSIWESLHGPDAWDANPWVCALTFTVHRGNIDSAP